MKSDDIYEQFSGYFWVVFGYFEKMKINTLINIKK